MYEHKKTKICQDSQVDMDEIPDSPSTVLGEDFDMDEMCQFVSISTSEKRFIIPETPPRSPSTLLGSTSSVDEMNFHSLNSDSGMSSDTGDSPGSPTTVLGDELFDGADSVSLTPESDVESNEHSEAENAPTVEASTRSGKYASWHRYPCEAVPRIYEWPAFIIEAFANRDWKFGLNSGDRAVLEVIAGREDLEAWFIKVREEWQNVRS